MRKGKYYIELRQDYLLRISNPRTHLTGGREFDTFLHCGATPYATLNQCTPDIEYRDEKKTLI